MKNNILERYEQWQKQEAMPPDLKNLLNDMRENSEEIQDCFYRDLEFGTGGLRGILGAGTNRMNLYTVGKATQGLANYLMGSVSGQVRVAIAYDSRIKSEEFARYAAGVFAANDICVWIYPRLQPTPALSWAVRELNCNAGICITASHNPAQYNGYKVYGSKGCQITPKEARKIQKEIGQVNLFRDIQTLNFDEGVRQGKICMISESVLDGYIDAACREGHIDVSGDVLKVVYTPLNGAGRECVLKALERLGGIEVTVVPEQEWPDGNFPTCPYPNPEIRQALEKGLELCSIVRPDLLLATDPDCDRAGIAVAEGDEWVILTGNEVGILLLDYLCRQRREKCHDSMSAVAVTTIVSTDMADAVCNKYGVELRRTPTGFKFIGEQIGQLEDAGEAGRYLFGFEESCGYLSGRYVRDKDAVNAAVLICSMAVYYKKKGRTLSEAMQALYEEFGWYRNKLLSFNFDGADGIYTMQHIMDRLRTALPKQVGGMKVTGVTDYKKKIGDMPKVDVLEIHLEKGGKLLVRPSGTEPKMKLYCFVRQNSRAEAINAMEKLSQGAVELLRKSQKTWLDRV